MLYDTDNFCKLLNLTFLNGHIANGTFQFPAKIDFATIFKHMSIIHEEEMRVVAVQGSTFCIIVRSNGIIDRSAVFTFGQFFTVVHDTPRGDTNAIDVCGGRALQRFTYVLHDAGVRSARYHPCASCLYNLN